MLEEERKFEVDPRFTLPDLAGVLPAHGRIVARPPVSLRATYYDTPDLRLARAGASLRFRRGDERPWTVKLPTPVPEVRHEISRSGPPGAVPAELAALVTVFTRGAPLAPAVVLRSTRRVYQVRGRDGEVLAELDDDLVAVLDGRAVRERFREVEVERKAGGRKLLRRIGEALSAAGAHSGAFVPKHVRALHATAPADLTPPATQPVGVDVAAVVTEAIRADIGRMLAYDPLVRLRAALPGGDSAVHQMRVGCRRLRTDLRAFRRVLDPGWAQELRAELAWVAGALGAVRDAEVLRARLRRTAAADPVAPLDPDALARLDGELRTRYDEAYRTLDEALTSPRYLALLDRLVDAAAAVRLAGRWRARPARDLLPRLAGRSWRRLAEGSGGVPAAGALDPLAPDESWHAVRIRAKRARYVTDAVARVTGDACGASAKRRSTAGDACGAGAKRRSTAGGAAGKLSRRLGRVQDLLGEHQDAVIAARTWLSIAGSAPEDHELAVTAGRLAERERAAVRRARARFPAVWAAASRAELTGWLS